MGLIFAVQHCFSPGGAFGGYIQNEYAFFMDLPMSSFIIFADSIKCQFGGSIWGLPLCNGSCLYFHSGYFDYKSTFEQFLTSTAV